MHHSTFVRRLLYKIAAFTAKLFANMLFGRKEEITREKNLDWCTTFTIDFMFVNCQLSRYFNGFQPLLAYEITVRFNILNIQSHSQRKHFLNIVTGINFFYASSWKRRNDYHHQTAGRWVIICVDLSIFACVYLRDYLLVCLYMSMCAWV